MIGELPSPEVVAQRQESYTKWCQGVSRPQPQGHGFVPTQSKPLHWTPLTKPLSECTVALVSTGGVHLKDQEPYAVYEREGDWSNRPIPGDVDTSELTFTHTHYETRDADADPNVLFPLDRVREFAAEGIVGQASPLHFGFMGFIPDPKHLLDDTAPAAAQALVEHGVDAVVLTGG